MGITFGRTVRKSIISFIGPWRCTEEDLPYFRGTISCRPCNDTTGKEILDWEELDDYNERSMDETRDW
jgi:hypothetical protein